MLDVLDSVASGVLHLVVVIVLIGPFMWWGARQRGEQLFATSAARSLVLAATVYLVAMAMLRLPQLGFYDDLQFNWVNKALIFVALLLLIRLLPEISWRDRWLTVTISLLFGLGHGLMFTNGFELTFDIASVVFTGLLGAAFMEIRLRWDSLLPAVLAHNAWNSSIAVANLIVS